MIPIGIFLFEYLPYTETFIYDAIRNLENFSPHILAKMYNEHTQFKLESQKYIYDFLETPMRSSFLYYAKLHFFTNRVLNRLLKKNERFVKYIAAQHIQLLHSHFLLDGLYALSISTAARIPCVVSLLGGYDTEVFLNLKHFPKKYLFEHTSFFTVPCQYAKNRLLEYGCPENKIKIVHCGVQVFSESSCKRKDPGDTIKILLVGRMTEKKGILDAIAAVACLSRRHPNIVLTIVGAQKEEISAILKRILINMGFRFVVNSQVGYQKKVQVLIQKLQCKNNVFIHPQMPQGEIRRMMRDHDIFLLPSKTASDGDKEGTPVVLLEAQAEGLPVITTEHAGNAEIVIDGKTGFVIPEGDVNSIVEKLEILINNRELRLTMGEEGIRFVADHFSQKQYIYGLESVYREALKS